jgi:DNA-binding MarR family transcriptional regulator
LTKGYNIVSSATIPETHLDAWRGVLNAHAAVVGRVEDALAAADLPPLGWYDVLWALRRAPRRRLRLSELAAGLTLSRGGLTKLVDRLEEGGLLRRERAAEDGRGLYAVLTPAGARMLRAMWPVYAAALSETFVAAVDDAEARVIAEALNRPLA